MKAIKGISINGEIHTANNLDMVLLKAESAAENPEPKLLEEAIPGRHGKLDYSAYYDGVTFYSNRKVSYRLFCSGTPAEVNETVTRLNRYHGRIITIVEDDDIDYSISGRATVSVEQLAPYGNYAYIVISLDADPFRYKRIPTIIRRTFSGTELIAVDNNTASVPLTLRISSMTNAGSNAAVRISTIGSELSERVAVIGEDIRITNFLLKGGAQTIKLETVAISGASWHVDNSITAVVAVSYTEGKF